MALLDISVTKEYILNEIHNEEQMRYTFFKVPDSKDLDIVLKIEIITIITSKIDVERKIFGISASAEFKAEFKNML